MSRFMSLTSLCIKIWVEFIFVVWDHGVRVLWFGNSSVGRQRGGHSGFLSL
jgi:hypothetical protein